MDLDDALQAAGDYGRAGCKSVTGTDGEGRWFRVNEFSDRKRQLAEEFMHPGRLFPWSSPLEWSALPAGVDWIPPLWIGDIRQELIKRWPGAGLAPVSERPGGQDLRPG